jgi:hypothetical protein
MSFSKEDFLVGILIALFFATASSALKTGHTGAAEEHLLADQRSVVTSGMADRWNLRL